MIINVYEAKAKLSLLLKRAQAGEEIVIARAGKPIARLMPIAPVQETRSGVRFGGLNMEGLQLSDDFYEPMTDDDLLGT